jgi:hypothetical protein
MYWIQKTGRAGTGKSAPFWTAGIFPKPLAGSEKPDGHNFFKKGLESRPGVSILPLSLPSAPCASNAGRAKEVSTKATVLSSYFSRKISLEKY